MPTMRQFWQSMPGERGFAYQDRFGNANSAFSFDGEQSYLLAPNADSSIPIIRP